MKIDIDVQNGIGLGLVCLDGFGWSVDEISGAWLYLIFWSFTSFFHNLTDKLKIKFELAQKTLNLSSFWTREPPGKLQISKTTDITIAILFAGL